MKHTNGFYSLHHLHYLHCLYCLNDLHCLHLNIGSKGKATKQCMENNWTFANMHVRSVLFITCRQGSRLRVALAQIFRMRASTSLFPLTQRYFYRALVLTPIHFFLIKINFEATCESKSSP